MVQKEGMMGGLIVPEPYARMLKEAAEEGKAIKGEDIMPKIRRATGLTVDKRKMIEKALGSCKEYPFKRHCLLDEPDQPIAIECEIIQGAKLVSKAPVTEIHLDPDGLDEYSETYIILPGHPLPEGKALAIIIPLEEE